jgi:hypothetical protein
MNKNFLIFGILGFIALSLVTGAVINYLSNTTRADISVSSPFIIGFADNGEMVEVLNLPEVVGGDTFSFETRVESLTSIDANVNLQFVFSNGLGDVTIEDFGNIDVNVRSDGMGSYNFFTGSFADFCVFEGLGHGANTCVIDNGEMIVTIPNFFFAKEKAEIFTDLQFNLAVKPTNYDIEATVMVR